MRGDVLECKPAPAFAYLAYVSLTPEPVKEAVLSHFVAIPSVKTRYGDHWEASKWSRWMGLFYFYFLRSVYSSSIIVGQPTNTFEYSFVAFSAL